MSCVLVTGGAGFVGAYVVRDLLAAGEEVVVYDAHLKGNVLGLIIPDRQAHGPVLESGEITDVPRLRQICIDHHVDQIVHLASPLTQDVAANPSAGVRDVCLGTDAVFDVARFQAMRRVVFASSVAVFGSVDQYSSGPVANNALHAPGSLYGSGKSLCEKLAQQYFINDQLDTIGLRLSVVYGAGRLRGYMSHPSHLIRQASLRQKLMVPYGAQIMHWQYVEEVAAMVLAALNHDRSIGGRSFNTVGQSRSFADAVEVLRSQHPKLDASVGHASDPSLAGVIQEYDDSELRKTLGYTPTWSFEDGVLGALSAYQQIISRGLESTLENP